MPWRDCCRAMKRTSPCWKGASDVSEGASKANSGIVHAGFDAKPGTLKAKLNVEGARMYPALCAEVDAPYGQPGAMVLAFTEEERRQHPNAV